MSRYRPRIRSIAAAALAATIGARVVAAEPPDVGHAYRWRVSLQAGLEAQPGQAPSQSNIHGEWSAEVVAVRPDAYDVRLQLTSVQLSGDRGGAIDAKALAAAQQRLATPFWATYAANGTMVEVHFPSAMPASDRNLLQIIATETQFVANRTAKPVWTTMERDGGGAYTAVYQQIDGRHARKRKLAYVSGDPSADGALPVTVAVDGSESTFTLTPDGAVSTLDSLQRVRLGLPGSGAGSLVTTIEVHLADLHEAPSAPVVGRAVPSTGIDHLPVTSHQPDRQAAERDADEALLVGHSTDQVLADAPVSGAVNQQRLAALFRRRPEAISAAMTRLSNPSVVLPIAGALAAAGTPRAEQALAGLATDTGSSSRVRVAALSGLEALKAPSVAAMRVPLALLDDSDADVRNAARLAAGAMSRAGRSAHAGEADAIDAVLVSRAASSTAWPDRQQYLAALGNSGSATVAVPLKASLADRDERIRASAARNLRLVAGTEADALLATAATGDASSTVRDAALFALDFRTPLTARSWTAVLKAARDDESPVVRARAIALIRNDRTRPAEAVVTLEWVAAHDPAERLRSAASKALSEIARAPAGAPMH